MRCALTFLLLVMSWTGLAQAPYQRQLFTTNTAGNANQFSATAGTVSIKSNVLLTNVTVQGNLRVPTIGSNYIVQTDSAANLLALTVGSGLAFDGATLINSAPADTNSITSVTINSTTNIFNVGKGGHLTISSNLAVLQVGPSKIVRTDSSTNLAATTIGTGLTFNGTTLSRDALTGDVTTSGNAATIANDAVTYAKMQNVSAASRLLGRGSAAGSGDAEEITLGSGLTMSGTALSASAGGGTPGFDIQSNYRISANQTNIDNGTAGTNAFMIVGGSGSSVTNGANLLAAYLWATNATPHGVALSTSNRFTIFLAPGVYDLGTSTLFLTAQYIDIVGISPNTGTKFYYSNWALTEYGDTVVKGSRDVITMTNSGINDITLANMCIAPPGATYYGFRHNVTSKPFKMINILFNCGGFSGGDRLPMTQNKSMDGYFEDVRSWYYYSFVGYGFVAGNDASGVFVRCRASVASFGQSTTGTFIDCVEEGTVTGDSWGKTSATGTYVNCRGINSFEGTVAPVLMANCYWSSGGAPTISGGIVINSTFNTTTYNTGTTFFGVGSSATTAAVNIAATGWTNTFTGRNAVVYYDGTAVTATVYNGAGTAVYTNAVALTGNSSIILQPSGKVILSGTGVTGRATIF